MRSVVAVLARKKRRSQQRRVAFGGRGHKDQRVSIPQNEMSEHAPRPIDASLAD